MRPRGKSAPAGAWLLGAALALYASAGAAAQIVVLDLKPKGVSSRLAAALDPLLVAELGKREGMSVISQADVRALLEHEADKAALGCDDASCMTDIAGSLGAELVVSSSVSRVGREIVVALALIRVDGASVVRRSTGRAHGGEGAAPEAVVSAVHELFRSGLPSELQGPASLSRRGFQAALAGLRRAVLDPDTDPKPSRRRVVLDIVNTELDYDAEPKLAMLQREVREGRFEATRRHLGARDQKEAEHYRRAMETYTALFHDHGRVKEIRERARERGLTPSARPLRFEDPEPYERPETEDIQRYFTDSAKPRYVVRKMVKALDRGDRAAYRAAWTKDRQERAERDFDSRRSRAERYRHTWELLEPWAHPPDLLRRAVRSLEPRERVVFVVRKKGGRIDQERVVRLVKEEGVWRVKQW